MYKKKYKYVIVRNYVVARRGGRVVEGDGLENRCRDSSLPWVRIPPSPPFNSPILCAYVVVAE